MAGKDVVKNKARKQLWDSLLEVYEREAHKENISHCKEVSVAELEDWTLENPDTSLRALPQLVESNPRLVSKVLSTGTTHVKLSNEKKKDLKQTKKKRKQEISSCQPTKRRKKVDPIKQKSKVKRDNSESNNRKLKTKITTGQIFNEHLKTNLIKNQMNNVDNQIKGDYYSNHKCTLDLRFFNEIENAPVRSDGRTFKCQLVFKVCSCLESDIVF